MSNEKDKMEINIKCYVYPNYEEKYFIELRELWKKAQYSIPFHRWLKYSLKNYGLRVRRSRQKPIDAGRPPILAYASIKAAMPLLKSVATRKKIKINIGDMKIGKDGIENPEGSELAVILRRPRHTGGHLRLVRN